MEKLNSDSKKPLDFVDLILPNLPPPHHQTGYLVAFFEYVYLVGKKEAGVHRAFQNAFTTLASRIYIAFQHHIIRVNEADRLGPKELSSISSNSQAILEHMLTLIDKVEEEILRYKPCCAVWNEDPSVECELLEENHHNVPHKSSKTRKIPMPIGGILGWLGFHHDIDVAITWVGNYTDPSDRESLLEITKKNAEDHKAVTIRDFWQHHSLYLSSDLFQTPSYRVCLGCLLQLPTEQLACGHILCANCCQENKKSKSVVKCPFCDKEVLWDHAELPEGAGYRILSLDAGGIRGIVTAMILVQIETLIGIPITNLFDLIVGSGSGGLIALSYGEGKRMEQLLALFHTIGKKAFVPVSVFGIPVPQSLLWYKYKRAPLHQVLSRYFSRKPLLGISPTRIAVVGGVPSVEPYICLFSSYWPANRKYKNQMSGTVAEIAEIFGSGTYFDVC